MVPSFARKPRAVDVAKSLVEGRHRVLRAMDHSAVEFGDSPIRNAQHDLTRPARFRVGRIARARFVITPFSEICAKFDARSN